MPTHQRIAAGAGASKPNAELPDVLQFMRLLWGVVHALQKSSKRMARGVGVTGPQRLAVRVVGLFPGVSAGQLATILNIHPSTLTGVLSRLSDQRLVARSIDPDDARRAVLHLTPLGERVNAVRRGTVEASVAEALCRMSGGERAAARRVLELLVVCLEQGSSNDRTSARERASSRQKAEAMKHDHHGVGLKAEVTNGPAWLPPQAGRTK